MTTIIPDSEAIKRALKWISDYLEETPDLDLKKVLNEAILRFDLSPKEADFLIDFYKKR